MEYKVMYLMMVTADANNNKYYKMIPKGDTFIVEYGRVGSKPQVRSYPIKDWNKKLREKLSKGYTDKSELMEDLIQEEKPKEKKLYLDIPNKDIQNIVDRLQKMAKQTISANYNITSDKVTQAMVDKAQDILTNLIAIQNVDDFNKLLLELFEVIPRKMHKVSEYLAQTKDDFSKIIQKEQDLLDVMKGQVYQHSVTQSAENEQVEDNSPTMNILEAMGLEFQPVDDLDIVKIKYHLGQDENKFYRAWKVTNKATQQSFDTYIKDNNNPTTKLLWHGSRNENWWSIINSGLVLRPTNAVITGKMFGYGIYFATKARKSIGYTSLSGSYWARGSSTSAFMGLYEVAYGKPFDVYSFDSKYYSLNYENLQKMCQGANCLHAHAGKMLANDEIIVYQQPQTTIKYLVEIR
ncbi:MAG: WGR domain-containing protein [Ruminococcus sp.]|nr:WGR domain-containing protein [Ruminococcus sp.]